VIFDIYDYAATVVGGVIRPGDDAADARWVGAAELRALPTTTGLIEALTDWAVLPHDG
jgi:8-oxo-dGTP diphosphatase